MTKPYLTCFPRFPWDITGKYPKDVDEGTKFTDYKMCMLDPYGFLFPYGNVKEKPIMYFRHGYFNEVRFNGFTNFGDTPLSPQSPGIFHNSVAQKNATVTKPYEKISENPLEYIIETDNLHSEIHLFEDMCKVKEGQILDLTAKPIPITIFDHGGTFADAVVMNQPCIFSGYFNGIPVIGMGNYDRTYVPETLTKNVNDDAAYIYIAGDGIRQDGRIESYLVIINFESDMFETTVLGLYWLEGEDPIIVNDASIEGDWYRLPYVDDGTIIFKDAVFHIGNKRINFTAKWGSKGFTEKPRIERHGQAQVFGTFYEGDEPYEHELFYTFNETLSIYDRTLEKHGYRIRS